ncbi:hypothetical protein [Vibrio ishigakensis]|uniref:hypothetical protein n=1 Tax=Vibrio ishigakensis TaxID=1481914 RepID=UPI0021C46720|nr:hypothetical protein [Vibrio ishigakensis]
MLVGGQRAKRLSIDKLCDGAALAFQWGVPANTPASSSSTGMNWSGWGYLPR